MSERHPGQPGSTMVNIIEAFKLANDVTQLVGGKDLALVATAFGMVIGRAAQTIPSDQVSILQNHVSKYIADFAAKPQ